MVEAAKKHADQGLPEPDWRATRKWKWWLQNDAAKENVSDKGRYRNQLPFRDGLVALWQDIGVGLPIAGTVAAWIPTEL